MTRFLNPLYMLFALFSGFSTAHEITLVSGHIVNVQTGAKESESVGSYALRLYKPLNENFPYDNFINGLVMPREGQVFDVKTLDLNNDNLQEIVVLIRSAGSGGYVSADIFSLVEGQLRLSKHFEDIQLKQPLENQLKID